MRNISIEARYALNPETHESRCCFQSKRFVQNRKPQADEISLWEPFKSHDGNDRMLQRDCRPAAPHGCITGVIQKLLQDGAATSKNFFVGILTQAEMLKEETQGKACLNYFVGLG
jgi:hypothetical protein